MTSMIDAHPTWPWVTLHNLHLEIKNDLLTYMYLKCTKMHHFVVNLIKTTAHQMQDFQLDKHQKMFGGRAPPGPAGGAWALLQTP